LKVDFEEGKEERDFEGGEARLRGDGRPMKRQGYPRKREKRMG